MDDQQDNLQSEFEFVPPAPLTLTSSARSPKHIGGGTQIQNITDAYRHPKRPKVDSATILE